MFTKPGADDGGEGRRGEPVEHAEEGGANRGGVPTVLVRLTTKGLELAVGELFASVLEGLIAATNHEGGAGGTGQHERLAMAQAVTAAALVQLAEALKERAELAGTEGARAAELFLVDGRSAKLSTTSTRCCRRVCQSALQRRKRKPGTREVRLG